jgi:predicted nuclease of predicted toxin-antitoxin system
MKFLADEYCDLALVDTLRAEGHDVYYVAESLRGGSDDAILTRAYSENRLLITEDKDFGELVYRLGQPARGIILLRFDTVDRAFKIPRLLTFLGQDPQRLSGSFVVIEIDKVRVRPLA